MTGTLVYRLLPQILAQVSPRRFSACFVVVALTLLGVIALNAEPERSSGTIPPTAPAFSSSRFLLMVRTLAGEDFAGRALGSAGAAMAADYLEKQFREIGLKPAPGFGHRQHFPVRLNLRLPDEASRNALAITSPASQVRLKLFDDYLPLPASPDVAIRDAKVVFAGYAIESTAPDYNDFGQLDVRDKVVVAFRREPREMEAASPFAGIDFTRHASFAAKAAALATRGAKALILVSNRLPDEHESALPAFPESTGPAKLPLPVLLARPASLSPFFIEQGLTLDGLARTIDRTLQPQSIVFPSAYRISMQVSIEGDSTTGANILGWLPGDPASEEYVVVGAHFDHVGRGERFSMAPGLKGVIHPGADDNASGISALVELARQLVREQQTATAPHGRHILFVAFGGEEHGLFGSAHLLHRQPIRGMRLVGMLNFDMVGRMRNNEIFAAGLDSIPELKPIATRAVAGSQLSLSTLDEYPYNMSDHGTFLDARIPAVLLFTGLHMEYHTPRDTPDRINADGTMKVLQVAHALLSAMRDPKTPLLFEGGKNPGYQRRFREASVPPNPFEFE